MKINITVKCKNGLHARNAVELVNTAKLFKSEIFINFQNNKLDAKNILSVLSGNIRQYDEIELEINGPDEKQALKSLESTLNYLY